MKFVADDLPSALPAPTLDAWLQNSILQSREWGLLKVVNLSKELTERKKNKHPLVTMFSKNPFSFRFCTGVIQ